MASTTRLQLFLDIASELGDLVTLTATGTGSTTSLVSTSDMLYGDGGLNGREVWFATSGGAGSASNVGTRRIVIDTDEDASTITVSPAWPAASISGDVVHLVNARATGVTIPEIHNKINQLIRRVGDTLATETADTAATFAQTSPKISIPTGWEYFLGIQVERDPSLTNVWDAMPPFHYRVDRWDSPKTVTIKQQFRSLWHNKRYRLIGGNSLSTLSTDATTTTVPPSWLAKTAAYELLEAAAAQGRAGDVATALTRGELLKQEAMLEEKRIGKRFAAIGPRIDLRQ